MEISVNELAPRRPARLLAGLAQAMSSTAQAAKIEVIERCREDAGVYVEQARARSLEEAGGLRNAADADIALLQAQADAQIESLRVETEARVARRHEMLQQQLAHLDPAADVEATRVQERVAAFQDELARLFEQLMQTGDPVAFAELASRMPSPPVFGAEPEPRVDVPERAAEAIRSEPPAGIAPTSAPVAPASAPVAPASAPVAPAPVPVASAPAPVASTRVPLAPGRLSGAGAVRGRLYTEWYGEVERLREIGDEADAVALLLDIVAGTEAESHADGSDIAHKPYQDLALIYRGRDDSEAEASILERFARQQHSPGPATSQLLERLASIRKPVRR
jgi:hypothetical protein